MDLTEHPGVVLDPTIRSGHPTVRGTRITVAQVLREVANEANFDGVTEHFPRLTREALRAALFYAADVVGADEAAQEAEVMKALDLVPAE